MERISDDIPPEMKIFEYGYPHSNTLLQFRLELEHCKPHNATHHSSKCDIINDVKLFPTFYRRIYCHKCLTLSNQTLHYKIKCIRRTHLCLVSQKLTCFCHKSDVIVSYLSQGHGYWTNFLNYFGC